MKDAFGGILNIVLVAIFLVIISGILGLVVNYTKAFRMKNTIITAIEQYEGAQGCFGKGTSSSSDCRRKIEQGASDLGYRPTVLNCDESKGYSVAYNLFCYKGIPTESGDNWMYTVVTQVDINIPIINRIMGLSIFQVHGDTRAVVHKWQSY